jgi:hypothetical protein
MKTTSHAIALLLVLASAAPGHAQPPAPPTSTTPPAPSTTEPAPREPAAQPERAAQAAQVLRERLQRRLDLAKAAQERFQEALDRLNKGEDPAAIERDMPMLLGPGERGDGPPMDRFRDRAGPRPPRGPDGPPRGGPDGPPGRGEPRPPGGPDDGRPGRPGDPIDADELARVLRGVGEPEGPLGVLAPRLNPEQRARVHDFITQRRPELAEALKELRASSPPLYDRTLDGLGSRFRGILESRDKDPEFTELRMKELRHYVDLIRSARVLGEAKAAGDAAKTDETRATIQRLLGEQFDLRTAIRRKQVEQLKVRADELAAEIDRQAGKRDEMLKRAGEALEEGAERFQRERRRGDRPPPPPPPPPPPGPRQPAEPGTREP